MRAIVVLESMLGPPAYESPRIVQDSFLVLLPGINSSCKTDLADVCSLSLALRCRSSA